MLDKRFKKTQTKLGLPNPLDQAMDAISDIQYKMSRYSINPWKIPRFPNPIATSTETGEEVAPPLSLNLPNVEAQTLAAGTS